MQKIYTLAREQISASMSELHTNLDFSLKETHWKPIEVENQLVVFEIHEKIGQLIQKEFSNFLSDQGRMSIYSQNGSLWKAEVQASGAESYFFARALFIALARIKSGTVNIKYLNCNLIEKYAVAAASRVIGNTSGIIIKAKDEKGLYTVIIPINGMRITFSHENVDMLCRGIGLQIRGCLISKKE